MKTKKTIWGRLALFTATFFWGTSFVVLKNALDHVDILWILAVRFSIAALLFSLFANRKLLHMTRENVRGSITRYTQLSPIARATVDTAGVAPATESAAGRMETP